MDIAAKAELLSLLFVLGVDFNKVFDDAIHGVFNTSDTESTIPIEEEDVTP